MISQYFDFLALFRVRFGQGFMDHQVRVPTGPNRSEIFKFLLVQVRSGPVRDFEIFLVPLGFGPWIPA